MRSLCSVASPVAPFEPFLRRALHFTAGYARQGLALTTFFSDTDLVSDAVYRVTLRKRAHREIIVSSIGQPVSIVWTVREK